MTTSGTTNTSPAACLKNVSLRYGTVQALNNVTLDLPSGCMVGIIGPDGVGKSSLFSLVAGSRVIQDGQVTVLGGDISDKHYRREICSKVAYMPQGLGKNLYPTLSVMENVDFFARLFGHDRHERKKRCNELLAATGLLPFANRPAGKLSGGMKQKLSLCCALIHDPDLLILDEPTTGVDPLSRRQFWELVNSIRTARPGISVLVATAYMEEASSFDWLIAMNAGTVLATGTPGQLLSQTGSRTLEEAFIALLPQAQREEHKPVLIPPRRIDADDEIVIEAHDLTMRFGDFVAVDSVNFQISRGEIFGFLGSNGCGKTTTMKMLTGLLEASEGEAQLFGRPVEARDIDTRRRVGYMTQAFSLYGELTVHQNLVLHARLFSMPEEQIPERVAEMTRRFGLDTVSNTLPDALPLGLRQRLSLAVAMIHGPDMLILDEPTSGVDPVARDAFWQIMADLSRNDGVTIFISTHFMNEAERCDRISLMHAGRVLVSDTPETLRTTRGTATLEEAFIGYLEDASAEFDTEVTMPLEKEPTEATSTTNTSSFSLTRMFSYNRREALELWRDPIRLTLALLGSAILMLVMGYGINMDVENLTFAVLDRDQSVASRDYTLNLAGSRYFSQKPPIKDYADLDKRMQAGEISLAIELPPDFGRDMARGNSVSVGAWIDGAMPTRAETVQGYVRGIHAQWLAARMQHSSTTATKRGEVSIETRYRYNPDVKSLPAMMPATIPILLLMIPAMLSALSVVREKELGSIINFSVTPVTKLEFLLGKQLPYIVLAFINFLMLTFMAVFVFGVPLKGSFITLALGAFLYVICATALGLVVSSFMRSQIAALFGTALLTLLPAVQFSGMVDPVSSLEGPGAIIGSIYPTTHFLTIVRGTFSKGLGFTDLYASFTPLLLAVPLLIGLGTILLRKQER